jgi:hypothetical protein
MTRTDLIAALESASGPSRELDAEIYAALNPLYYSASPNDENDFVPSVTASLDAAVTLVPDGLDWEVKTAPHRKGGIARVVSMERTTWAEAATPTMALCIACIKALESGE